MTLPSGGSDWRCGEALVANGGEAGARGRNRLTGGNLRAQNAALVNTELTRSSGRNTA